MVVRDEGGRSDHQMVNGARCARRSRDNCGGAVRARERSGRRNTASPADGAPDSLDGGRPDLCQFDGDVGLSAAGCPGWRLDSRRGDADAHLAGRGAKYTGGRWEKHGRGSPRDFL